MTKSGLVAMTEAMQGVVDGTESYSAIIKNRAKPIDEGFIDRILALSVFDWSGRTPSLLIDDHGDIVGHDFDFSSMFVPLSQRRAVIEIREYQNRRPLVMKVGMRKIGSLSFGPLTRLVSNQEAFSFSVHIRDHSIAMERDGKEELGFPMNYLVIDVDGTWYTGFETIHFRPDAPENKFLFEQNLLKDGTLSFKYFVHPNRYQSIFSAQYIRLKMLVERLDDEAQFYRAELKRLEDKGIKPNKPPSDEIDYEGESKKVTVTAFKAEIDMPDLLGTTADYALPGGDTITRAQAAYDRQRAITHSWKPRVQFVIRANEYAYWLHGMKDNKLPPWAKLLTIERDFKPKGARTTWSRIPISEEVALRFRVYEKSEKVAA